MRSVTPVVVDSILYLNEADVRPLVTMADIVKYCEEAYVAYGKWQAGKAHAAFSPMSSFATKTPHSDVDYRAGTLDPIPSICTTLGWGFWDNPRKNGLPSVWEIVCLNDLKTGKPLSVMHGYYLGGARTGGAGAVCSKYLAKKNSSKLGLIGAGTVNGYMLSAHLEVYKKFDEVRVWSRTSARREKFAKDMGKKHAIKIKSVESGREAVEGMDIVCVATPAREPIVKNEWVQEGVHINAFGADGRGKQELDPTILKRGKIIVDNLDQCKLGGEINVPLSQGLVSEKDVFGQIGEIVNGWKRGRTTDEEITIMDSTGIGALDVVTYHRAYEKALAKGIGRKIPL